jgi:hypothetical protein
MLRRDKRHAFNVLILYVLHYNLKNYYNILFKIKTEDLLYNVYMVLFVFIFLSVF